MEKHLMFGLFLIFTVSISSVQAQSATAALSGTVTDQQGAVVSGANVKIADKARAFERMIMTNGDGYFSFSQLAPTGRFDPGIDYGTSSFDVRHAFNGAVSYEIPSPFENGLARKIFGGFGIDAIFRARTATPVNLVSGANSLGFGVTTILRPDLISGQPLYIDDESAPGGRRFNPLAFDRATPLAQMRQGTLGRNILRGFPARQLDLSLRRQFNLSETINLQLRADGFNIFNTSNFANQSGVLGTNYLTSSSFGRASRTLSSGLGGLSSLYQIGGPRSFQLSAKLRF